MLSGRVAFEGVVHFEGIDPGTRRMAGGSQSSAAARHPDTHQDFGHRVSSGDRFRQSRGSGGRIATINAAHRPRGNVKLGTWTNQLLCGRQSPRGAAGGRIAG